MRAAASATVSANAGSSAGRSSSTRIEPGSHAGAGRSGDGGRTSNAPSTSAPMSATTRAVASHAALAAAGELNLPRWNEMRRSPLRVTTAFRRFASPALSGLSTRRRNSRSPVGGAEREHRLARLDVDEDLVPGGRSQRRAALAQRIGHAHEPHSVDGVVASAWCAGSGDSSHANASSAGSRVPARVRAERVRQVVVRVQARPGAPMILELDEDGLLQHPSEAREVGVRASRAPSTCCERARAR